jgi:hypothetical protein
MNATKPPIRNWFAAMAMLVVLFTGTNSIDADDGWRRTAHGWEHVSTWATESDLPVMPADCSYRPAQTIHPVLLAVLQLAGASLALALGARRKVD